MSRRVVIAIVDDLFVRSRIDAAATSLDIDVHYCRRGDSLAEAVRSHGSGLVLVGMAATRLPWESMLGELPRASRPFVLAFGPHKQLDLRERALAAGADRVVANSAFSRVLATLLDEPTAAVDEDDE
jgi:hypothetical protein